MLAESDADSDHDVEQVIRRICPVGAHLGP